MKGLRKSLVPPFCRSLLSCRLTRGSGYYFYQEIPHVLRNSKIHYSVCRSLPFSSFSDLYKFSPQLFATQLYETLEIYTSSYVKDFHANYLRQVSLPETSIHFFTAPQKSISRFSHPP
jgi:hypothetical protein